MTTRKLVGHSRSFSGAVIAGLLLAGVSGCAARQPDVPPPSPPATQRAVPSATAPAIPAPSPLPSAVESQPFHPEVGQCIDVRKDRPGGLESIVPCNEEHDDEAYARFALDGNPDTQYPGSAAIEQLANNGCHQRFTDFIGVRYEDSVFEFLPMYPAEHSWTVFGDRRVTCLVWYPRDSVTTSLRGAGY
ncbi:septum formation family protein [Cryobacterium sp. HLT2-28]|uniref:septum formation family protein n=1 Tax=Cryobacterium sp. HLT2-28 TaxID=1259146 RepID=UPI00141BA207